MQASALLSEISANLTDLVGTNLQIGQPSIYVGTPNSGVVSTGLEIIIDARPNFKIKGKGFWRENWAVTLNQFSADIENIYEAITRLEQLYIRCAPEINFIDRPRTLESKNFPVVKSAVVSFEIRELYSLHTHTPVFYI